jgi:hypothetical protein
MTWQLCASVRLGGASLCIGSGSRCDAMMLAIEFGFSIVCTAGMGAAFLPIVEAAEMTSTALMRFVADFSDSRAERVAA